jgi:DNA gyrase subunit A
MVMAYLYKHTPLQMNFAMNLTCLVPSPDAAPMQPQRLGIKEVLLHFLDFRLDVTRKRYQHELAQLQKRIHILEAFIKIFNALDETIKIIRASDGKEDAAQKLMKRFGLDAEQVEAILEMKLYKLAKLEINLLREEHSEKILAARKIEAILKSEAKLWGVVKGDLESVAMEFGTPRKTRTGGNVEEVEFDADAFIVDEDANVVVTRDGWLKRVRELKDPSSTRVREGDEVIAVLPGSTKEKVIFFTNRGSAYVSKINDISPTAGYGDPAQKYFKFADGERIVAAMTLDPRALLPETMLAVSRRGYGLRFALAPHTEMTTRAGRRYAKTQEGDEIVGVVGSAETDTVVVATRNAYVLVCKADEIAKLENPGRGVTVIKTADDDEVIAFISGGKSDVLDLQTEGGKKLPQNADPKHAKGRGGKGHQVIKRTQLSVVPRPVAITALATADGGEGVH